MNLLAVGNTAEVYTYKEGQILKLFYPRMGQAAAVYEADLSRQVAALGLPVPQVGDLVQHEGRWGILYEYIPGEPLERYVLSHLGQVKRVAFQFAHLQLSLLRPVPKGFPCLHDRLERNIQAVASLTQAEKSQLLTLLSRLPEGEYLCHGDFHLNNVLKQGDRLVVIDWIDAVRAHPVADLARSYLLIHNFMPRSTPADRRFHRFVRQFEEVYLGEWRRRFPNLNDQLARWVPVVAAGRLNEAIPQPQVMLRLVRAYLAAVVP